MVVVQPAMGFFQCVPLGLFDQAPLIDQNPQGSSSWHTGSDPLLVVALCRSATGGGGTNLRNKPLNIFYLQWKINKVWRETPLEVCTHCGYDLTGLPEAQCPERGTSFDPAIQGITLAEIS